MMTYGFSTGIATAGAIPRRTATTAHASTHVTGLWPAILAPWRGVTSRLARVP
jgi:hypothetical protein